MNLLFNVTDLVEGLTLAEDVSFPKNNKLIIFRAGKKLNQNDINYLINKEIVEVSISLSNEEKQKYEAFYNILGTIDSHTTNSTMKSLENIKKRKNLDEGTTKEIIESSSKIVNSILLSKSQFTYRLTDYKLNREPSAHAVRVAAYATAFAQNYNQRLEADYKVTAEEFKNKKLNLTTIAIASLLHDVGKTCEDKEVQNNLDNISFVSTLFPCTKEILPKLKSDEYNPKYVPLYGFNIIHGNTDLPSEVKVMVLLSGETNKSGILEASKNIMSQSSFDKCLTAAKIINFCSYFDEILLANVKDNVTLENANDKISALAKNGIFDEEFLDILIETVPLYPVGTKVKLQGTTNDFAVVCKNFQNNVRDYTRPILRTLSTNKIIDLRENYTTTIKEVVDGSKDAEFKNFMDSIKDAILNENFSQSNKDDDEPSR